MAPTKVLFIMGHSASGSTILGMVLGEVEGFFHTGELRTLWGEGLAGAQVCGCGLALERCDVWSSVLKRMLSDPSTAAAVDPAEVARWHRETVRVRHALHLLRLRPGHPTGWVALDRYLVVASALYRAIAESTGARVVVDSSKRSGDAAILRLIAGIDPYLVHLVRDPRAVVHSWQRHRRPGRAPFGSMRDWVAYNVIDEVVRRRYGPSRSMLVRHEDFTADPQGVVRRIASMVGESTGVLPFLDDHSVRLRRSHTVAGHGRRFDSGPVELREDDRWRRDQGRGTRALVTGLSLPLLLRYRYPVVVSRA